MHLKQLYFHTKHRKTGRVAKNNHLKTMKTLKTTQIETPIGNMLAGATPNGICLFEFIDVEDRLTRQTAHLEKIYSTKLVKGDSSLFEQLKIELDEYFSGSRKTFDVPLDFKGTNFQEQAWNALLKIPYGETRSYQDQAIAINKPKAVRAIAGANHRNKISILVPCHRVIGKNGSLTGYGGELWRKEFLLKLENAL
jgi:AraC family transcriptional regulator of adaptative response/methylated-DNA-[protein]-cysteine methyltransferase